MRAGVHSAVCWGERLALACLGLACADAAAGQSVESSNSASPVSEVVVTGSRIPQPSLAAISPIVRIDGDQMRAEGLIRLEDAINQLPQAFVEQSSTVTNGATGTATVNLRDLGPERTLVLIDGKRLLPGDPTAGSVAPDLNFIPDALVDHVDVVTGGASAVYGSDAVAGVVNVIMKHDLSGVRIDAELGAFGHSNHDAVVGPALAAQGIMAPSGPTAGGYSGEISLVAGADAPGGRGHLTVYGVYRQAAALTEAERDFSACALAASGRRLVCAGSSNSPATGRFLVLDPGSFQLRGDLTLDPTGPGNTLRPFDIGRDSYNYAPFDYFQRPDRRWSAGAFARYDVSPAVDLYADGMFMYDETVAQLAPSGLFADTPFSISCANPMLSAAEVQAFCTDANVPPGGTALVFIGHRDVNAGGRQDRLTHEDFRIVAGARGRLGDWRYDVSAQAASVAVTQLDLHDVSLSRAADAIDVVSQGGKLVCASGDAGCAPYDVFQLGGVTQAALAYIDTPGAATGGTSEAVVSASLTGRLGHVQSPWADAPADLALGAEWRRESLTYAPDAELASGDLAGAGYASPAVSGRFSVTELYAETRAPLAQSGRPLLRGLSFEGGYRFSWYSNAGEAQTYKAGLDWVILDGLALKSSYNHAVRAPNVVELFTPASISNIGLDFDPCAGADPVVDQMNPYATRANCARTGVSAAQYGHIAQSPAAYNALTGGNPGLRPEAADTWTVTLVLARSAVPGFTLTVDYYDIRVSGVITQIEPDIAIEQCLETGNPFLCAQIHREPGTGSLWLGADGYVSNLFQNAAALSTRGLDVDLDLRRPLVGASGRDLGSAELRLVGAYLMSLRSVTEPGAMPYDCAGSYGVDCGDPVPRWRHLARVDWRTPWHVDLSLGWRYVSSVLIAAASSNPVLRLPFDAADYRLGARSYVDIGVQWRVSAHLEARAGIDNLFDTDPPVVGVDYQSGVAANGDTYPGLYDALGRWMFIGVTARM